MRPKQIEQLLELYQDLWLREDNTVPASFTWANVAL